MIRLVGAQQPRLEQWSSTVFLVSGVLLLAAPGHLILETFTDASLPAWLIGGIVMPGLLASLIGLLAISPRLSNSPSRLVLAGAGSAAFAGAGILGILGWVVAWNFLPAVSNNSIPAVPPGYVFLVVMTTMALAFLLTGLGSLREHERQSSIGRHLLAFAAPWITILGVTPLFGADLPLWISLPAYGFMPAVMLSVSYVLRSDPSSVEHDGPSNEVAVG